MYANATTNRCADRHLPFFFSFFFSSLRFWDGGQEGSDFWHAASSLSLLTESLYEVWVLEPERRRDAESMREAGLEPVAAAATTTIITTTTTVVSLGFRIGRHERRRGAGGSACVLYVDAESPRNEYLTRMRTQLLNPHQLVHPFFHLSQYTEI